MDQQDEKRALKQLLTRGWFVLKMESLEKRGKRALVIPGRETNNAEVVCVPGNREKNFKLCQLLIMLTHEGCA